MSRVRSMPGPVLHFLPIEIVSITQIEFCFLSHSCAGTMVDATIPLTVAEWEEWGNPNEGKSQSHGSIRTNLALFHH
jgi:hypothetical protein